MKNRITSLFLTIALLVCAIPFAASASEPAAQEAKTPQIVSKNIEYGGNFAMIFAVDSETVVGETRLEMYDSKNVLINTYNVWKTEAITTADGTDYNALLFRTAGVAAKNMADYYYVKAVDSENNESALVRYSVAEYMYERLYGGEEITENQKALYESVIVMGSNAQQVLINDNPNFEDEVLVKNYKYVVLNEATVDGYSTGVYAENTQLTLTGTASVWEVKNADGTTESISGNTLTVTDHCTVAPYAGISTVYDFEGFAVGDITGESGTYSNNGVSITNHHLSSNTNTVGITQNVNENVSKMLKLTTTGTKNGYITFDYSSETNDNIKSYVFEFDMYFASTSGTSFQIGFGDGGISSINIYKGDVTFESFIKDGEVDTYYIGQKNNGGTGSDALANSETGTRVPADSWVNYRYEYYAKEGIIKVYVNGNYVGETDYLMKTGSVPARAMIFPTGSTKGEFYIDNVKVEKSTKTYTAPVTE